MEPMLQFFHYDHLPPHLKEVSRPFCDLAHQMVGKLPRNPERTVALRKLLEAKDAAVRSVIYIAPDSGLGKDVQAPTAEDYERTAKNPLLKARSVEDVIQDQKEQGGP